MENFYRRYELNLQLFAEGAGEGGGSEAAAGVAAGDPGQQETGVAAQQKAGAAADFPDQQDLGTAFEEMIKGQYKDQFNAKVHGIVSDRVKGLRTQLKAFDAAQPIFDFFAQKYGVDPSDYAAMATAIQEDVSLVEQEALAAGKDPQEFLKTRNMEVENATMRRQLESQRQAEERLRADQAARQQLDTWHQQEEEARKVFPGLRLEEEMKNPDFARMLQSGASVRAAYTAMHVDEIVSGAMQFAAQKAAKTVTDNVIAGAARPAENGTAAQGAVSAKVDPSKFTNKQIEEYIARAARGEHITF